MRRYADPIDVVVPGLAERSGDPDLPGAPPLAFRWRGRRYVVRRVLDTWQEATPWWVSDAPTGPGLTPAGADQRWWRVEAGRGQQVGVYELSCSPPAPGSAGAATVGWTLRRSHD